MKDKTYKEERAEVLRRGTSVETPDGEGVIVSANSMRKNTNGGPGVRQYVVCLLDGRIRHYGCNAVSKISKTL